MLAEIAVASIGKVFHVVIAVHDEHHGKQAPSVRHPDTAIEGQRSRIEPPVSGSRPACITFPPIDELRAIHGIRLERDCSSEFGSMLIITGSVGER